MSVSFAAARRKVTTPSPSELTADVTSKTALRCGQPLADAAPRTVWVSSRLPTPGWLFHVVDVLIGPVLLALMRYPALQSKSPVSVSVVFSVAESMMSPL